MSECPKCGNNIEDAFGIIQCSKCKTMLVADFEGNLKISSDSETETEERSEKSPDALPEAPFQMGSVPQDENNDWNFENEPAVSEAVDPVAPLESEPAPAVMSPAIQEINEFANSEASSAREGILYYHLQISGIDTVELKQLVQDGLADARLALNLASIMKSIKNGVLKISNLNAVKASVIVTRLKEYPLELSWTQMSLLDSEVNDEANL